MREMDFSPLFRATVGFDRMMNMLDTAHRLDEANAGYPPYNIEKLGENDYRVTMAVAGFSEADLDITVKESLLVVTGRKDKQGDDAEYLYRGIATRAFERRFNLADHIKVVGAKLENGLLFIDLVREVPEEMKARTIKIESDGKESSRKKVIEGQKVA